MLLALLQDKLRLSVLHEDLRLRDRIFREVASIYTRPIFPMGSDILTGDTADTRMPLLPTSQLMFGLRDSFNLTNNKNQKCVQTEIRDERLSPLQ